ncbi:MAG: TrkA C-terminal domain-containing protein [Actinomycetota bacterium]|nr:TrkA C-terminal domain-containing protein [Actinomycetota bacterium]
MVALASVLLVALVSLLITRVATMALTLTGLSREVARFQARSALSGVGFTTSEAESVVTHPIRRRIVLLLMLVGSAGIVTVMATLLLSFVNADREQALLRLVVLAGGLAAILFISKSPVVDRWLSRMIARGLTRWTDLDTRDYERLLHVGGDFAVVELVVRPEDWMAGCTLAELNLRDEGIAVLGVQRPDGRYVGSPIWATRIEPHDTVVAYGPAARLAELDQRPKGRRGDEAHERAVAEQREAVHPPS